MYVLITYNLTRMKKSNEKLRRGQNIIELYFPCSVVGGRVSPIIKIIQAFMGLHATCKNEEDPLKNEGAIVVTKISHCSLCRFL